MRVMGQLQGRVHPDWEAAIPMLPTRRSTHTRTASPAATIQQLLRASLEAWYTASGETCLETPQGTMIGRAGGAPVIVPEGPPMHLTATGTETRRALVLILHDSTQPPTTPARDWTPKGLCRS